MTLRSGQDTLVDTMCLVNKDCVGKFYILHNSDTMGGGRWEGVTFYQKLATSLSNTVPSYSHEVY